MQTIRNSNSAAAPTIHLTLPEGWAQLSDKQLMFAYRLLALGMSPVQVLTHCLLRWAGLRLLYREGGRYIMRHHRDTFPITVGQLAWAVGRLDYLNQLPAYPVRPSRIGRHRPLDATLQDASFETFLCIDNLYQGFLSTRDNGLLDSLFALMYQTRERTRTPSQRVAVFYWVASLKQYLARMFPAFFRPAAQSSSLALSPTSQQDIVNTQIRALTHGDPTRERDVLALPCHSALWELNQQAREYEELHRKYK